jgi:uncharacterized protein DUF1566
MLNRMSKNPTLRAAAGVVALVCWCLLLGTAASALPTPAQRCQAGKNRAAGRYASCRQGAEAALVASGNTTRYSNAILMCETRFANKWQKLIDRAAAAGATCPDAPLTGAQFKTVIDEHSDNVTTGLNGGGLQDCPPDLSQCQSDLAACLANTLPADRVLKTGQTGCYDASGTGISCSGTGQDGDLHKGQVRSYTDNGDGTITDNQTGLIWEKKSDDGSIHDKDNTYTWDDAFGVFIAGLNTATFAGQSDWRLPNRFELESLLDLGQENPSIGSAFNTNCGLNSSGNPACAVVSCSCTAPLAYWSSTTSVATPSFAWSVFFFLGGVNFDDKATTMNSVRAVRGGL